MTSDTAKMLWWAIGWGGYIDAKMLSSMRGSSMRGARDALSAAVERGWLRRWYVHERCAIYQVTDAGRAMCISMEMPVPNTRDGLRHRIVEGKFVPSRLWEHARRAAIFTAGFVSAFLGVEAIGPDMVVPMFLIGQQAGQKTPDCILTDSNSAIAIEYENSQKRGRQARHRNWMTLAKFIGDVAAHEVKFRGVPVKRIVVAYSAEIEVEIRKTLKRYCREIANWRHRALWWTWFDGTSIQDTGVLSEDPYEPEDPYE